MQIVLSFASKALAIVAFVSYPSSCGEQYGQESLVAKVPFALFHIL
jgi:hypothetical protein